MHKETIKMFTPMRETRLISEIVHQQIKIIVNYLSYPFSIQSEFLPFGPSQIISEDDEIAANKAINEIINDLNYDDNILLNCTADIGVEIINEKVKHVVGIGSAGFKKALEIEDTFSIIVPTEDYIQSIKAQIERLCIDKNVSGIFSLDFEVYKFFYDTETAVDRVINIIEDNGLEDSGSILFGCGTMILFYENMRTERFFQKIVEPTIAGILDLESEIVRNKYFRNGF
jgi:Asp/Glu/hydantoin racemase